MVAAQPVAGPVAELVVVPATEPVDRLVGLVPVDLLAVVRL